MVILSWWKMFMCFCSRVRDWCWRCGQWTLITGETTISCKILLLFFFVVVVSFGCGGWGVRGGGGALLVSFPAPLFLPMLARGKKEGLVVWLGFTRIQRRNLCVANHDIVSFRIIRTLLLYFIKKMAETQRQTTKQG